MRRLLLLLAAPGCLSSIPPGGGATDGARAADLARATGDLAVAPGSDLAVSGVADLACVSPDLAPGANYPGGPYGNKVGDTFPMLEWEGFVNEAADAVATTKNYGPYTADALRRTGRHWALVHVSEYI